MLECKKEKYSKYIMTTRNYKIPHIALFFFLLTLVGIYFYLNYSSGNQFNNFRAFQDIRFQVSLGPRTIGSIAHSKAIQYISHELKLSHWNVSLQSTQWKGYPIKNIIASKFESPPEIIIGAHFDSRSVASRENSIIKQTVPGANDGASGVAILLELSRCLSNHNYPLWLVFFDAEDDGGINNREWIMGSKAFVSALGSKPEAVIILDMVGDKDLGIYMEQNSNFQLTEEIWKSGKSLGYSNVFLDTIKYNLLDDHSSFLEVGIPAALVIDFDYPYWHTSNDTLDKVSASSLGIVGNTILRWLEMRYR
jgi:glutaminyl-peptide cyclotransferase